MLREYKARLRSIGLVPYLRELFFLDFVGVLIAPLFLGFFALMFWLEGVTVRPPEVLTIVVCVFVGRVLFHCRIGAFASEGAAFTAGLVVVPAITFAYWWWTGFRPVYHEELTALLGLVGSGLSYLIAWPLFFLVFCVAMFIPWWLVRGFRGSSAS